MAKLSNKQNRHFSFIFGVLFLGFAVFCWMPFQEPIRIIHYERAIIYTAIGIYLLFEAIKGERDFNKKAKNKK
jgi:hypothetical protein